MCNHLGSITMGISLSVCLYCCMWVCVGSSVSNPAMKSHLFVQSGQDGSECCWTWYRLIRVRMIK